MADASIHYSPLQLHDMAKDSYEEDLHTSLYAEIVERFPLGITIAFEFSGGVGTPPTLH